MKFTKMQGIGNDYVYVDCFQETVEDPGKTAVFVSDRHFGIGSDGLILIKPSTVADCQMDMYNLDGSRGAMCGNGVRCVGKYAYDHGIVPPERTTLTVETASGIKTLKVQAENGKARQLTVDMGKPEMTSELFEPIAVEGEEYRLSEFPWEIPMQSCLWTIRRQCLWKPLGRNLKTTAASRTEPTQSLWRLWTEDILK